MCAPPPQNLYFKIHICFYLFTLRPAVSFVCVPDFTLESPDGVSLTIKNMRLALCMAVRNVKFKLTVLDGIYLLVRLQENPIVPGYKKK